MNGTEKQVQWATKIKKDALEKVARYFDREEISKEQYQALILLAESKDDASWWIDRRLEFRNSSTTSATLADATKGYGKLPKGKKANPFF